MSLNLMKHSLHRRPFKEIPGLRGGLPTTHCHVPDACQRPGVQQLAVQRVLL